METVEIVKALKTKLKALKTGDCCSMGAIDFVPLYWDGENKTPDYCLLSDAIETGVADVQEVSDHGTVPELKVSSRSGKPILAPEGEIVVGGKQNRVINATILIPANVEFSLPVSCVEQGRWRSIGSRFVARYFSTPEIRKHKTMSVKQGRGHDQERRSDQGLVWRKVEEELISRNTYSSTGSLTDALDHDIRQRSELNESGELSLPENACGFLAYVDGVWIGMDLFARPDTLRSLWPRIRDSYCSALVNAQRQRTEVRKPINPTSEIKRIKKAITIAKGETIGLGYEIDSLENTGIIAEGVWHEDSVIHMSAFAE